MVLSRLKGASSNTKLFGNIAAHNYWFQFQFLLDQISYIPIC